MVGIPPSMPPQSPMGDFGVTDQMRQQLTSLSSDMNAIQSAMETLNNGIASSPNEPLTDAMLTPLRDAAAPFLKTWDSLSSEGFYKQNVYDTSAAGQLISTLTDDDGPGGGLIGQLRNLSGSEPVSQHWTLGDIRSQVSDWLDDISGMQNDISRI